MRPLFTFLVLVILFFCATKRLDAQVAVRLNAAENKLTVSYQSIGYYYGWWGNHRFTLKYKTDCGVDFSNLTRLTPFQFSDAGPAVIAGDYSYKTFVVNTWPTANFNLFSLVQYASYDIFSVDATVDSSCYFEILEATLPANAGAPSIAGPLLFNLSVNQNVAQVQKTASQSVFRPVMAAPATADTEPFDMDISFHTQVFGLAIEDFDVTNATMTAITQVTDSLYALTLAPVAEGVVTARLKVNSVTSIFGLQNAHTSTLGSTMFSRRKSCFVQYHLKDEPDGSYTVSLIPSQNWSGTDAITATAQVTLVTGNQYDHFTISDLTMLTPGVTFAQNSRYDSPFQNNTKDYISFGLTSYGTNLIPYVSGDTVPLFRFKNKGVCSGDSLYLMPISGDPFAWPNLLNANVGQQLSVSGYNEPDVPLCVAGVVPCMAERDFNFKVLLQGAYNSADGMMHDQLRAQGLIPLQEPYYDYAPIRDSNYRPFEHRDEGGNAVITDPSILNAQLLPENDIVDWVYIELRSLVNRDTVLSTMSALVQRDGDVVSTDGTSFVQLNKVRENGYFFAVRHRNHLGLMSTFPQYLGTGASTFFDFTSTDNCMYGEQCVFIQRPGDPDPTFSEHPSYIKDGKRLLWAGNSNADRYVMFQGGGVGEGLDIDNVFDNIFSDPLNVDYSYNHVRNGYFPGDNNLDGKVKYQGPANDVDPFIFFNIISRHPDNVDKFINFYITEGLLRP
jgi:hypothetical protein